MWLRLIQNWRKIQKKAGSIGHLANKKGYLFHYLNLCSAQQSIPVTTDRVEAQMDMENFCSIPGRACADYEDNICDHEGCMIPNALHIAASF